MFKAPVHPYFLAQEDALDFRVSSCEIPVSDLESYFWILICSHWINFTFHFPSHLPQWKTSACHLLKIRKLAPWKVKWLRQGRMQWLAKPGPWPWTSRSPWTLVMLSNSATQNLVPHTPLTHTVCLANRMWIHLDMLPSVYSGWIQPKGTRTAGQIPTVSLCFPIGMWLWMEVSEKSMEVTADICTL